MNLRNTSLFALIGMALVSILQVWHFVGNVLNVAQGAVAPVVLVASFIYAFAAVAVTLFFHSFHRKQG
jgi:hypothetical protein